jgi:hypothetical protein
MNVVTSSAGRGPGKPAWRTLVFVGVALIIQPLFDWNWAGPWNDASFTRGIFAIVGGTMVYRGWYRVTFGRIGLIPELRLWQHPLRSTRHVALVGGIFAVAAWLAGHTLQPLLPEPTGLLLGVISLLCLLLAGYAWLSFGILADEEE